MEVLGLYDEEMSLFGGDLLGIAPAPVEDRFSEDVLKSSIRGHNVVTVLPGQDVLGLEQSNKNYSGQIDQSWLDTKIDLLDYLADEVSSVIEDAAPSQSLDIKPIEASNDDDGSTALKVLQSVADDTIAMIMSETESGEASEQQPMETEEENNSSLLLEMLTSDLTECISATDLEPLVEDSVILSPVTPEDVETVLSSGPPSPTAELSLLDSTDSSFVDSSFTSSSEQTPVYLDLAQLLQQVQSNAPQVPESDDSSLEDLADPTYEPYPAKKVRSKSREHKMKKASTAIAKPSKEAKQLERKLRKKQQNKDAALRYREKKRQEQNLIDEECDQLEQRNVELRDRVGQMTREISYLKNLLAEVYEAKGLVKKSK